MDPLSDVLRAFTLDGGVFLDAQFAAPWSILSQMEAVDLRYELPSSAQIIAYHYVVAGEPYIQVADRPPERLQPGEVVLLPRNDVHQLASTPELAPIDIHPMITRAREGAMGKLRLGGNGEVTQIVCGYIGCEAGRHPLIESLPVLLRLNVREWEAGSWVETLFRYAAQESLARRPGCSSSLAKVSELLFIEAIRRHMQAVPGARQGWLAGLTDPVVGRALALMHEHPEKQWTVDAVAEHAHLSRSAFAERFTAMVGMPPLGYLAAWRMQLARRALRQGCTVLQAAVRVGYESEAAFSRAFKREVGVSPSAFRRRA